MDILTFLQQHGLSRRGTLALLENKSIKKNGDIITYRKEPLEKGDIVTCTIDGETQTRYVEKNKKEIKIVLYNKPKGCVVSRNDKYNTTIYDLLPEGRDIVYTPIGRLDKDSHGLLILTNDKKLVSEYGHPSNNYTKKYIVYTKHPLNEQDIKKAKKGVIYFDKDLGKDEELIFSDCIAIKGKKNTYEITLHGGKKRHIRRLIESLHNEVLDLQRTHFGPWELGNIALGKRSIQPYNA